MTLSLFKRFHLGIIILSILLGLIGTMALYSAAHGLWSPWALSHLLRLGLGLAVMIIIGIVPINRILYSVYPIYILAFSLLILVPFFGTIGFGAKRWIGLYGIQIQPSELMRVAVILIIARYFHFVEDKKHIGLFAMMPLLVAVFAPMVLVLIQPDLGTALVMVMTAITMIYLAGLRLGVFLVGGSLMLFSLPFTWNFLRPYQKQRVLSFINPESDPLGSGYHIIQSKIAFGSGGITGRGFLEGPQTQLSFLPESHTDFVLTVIGEELGLLGTSITIILWVTMTFMAFRIGLSCKYKFGKILGCGIGVLFFFYFFINNAMVVGLLPVVGVPMPLVSYGGSAILSSYIALGLLQSIYAWNKNEY